MQTETEFENELLFILAKIDFFLRLCAYSMCYSMIFYV